jgi:hypothetical protein
VTASTSDGCNDLTTGRSTACLSSLRYDLSTENAIRGKRIVEQAADRPITEDGGTRSFRVYASHSFKMDWETRILPRKEKMTWFVVVVHLDCVYATVTS